MRLFGMASSVMDMELVTWNTIGGVVMVRYSGQLCTSVIKIPVLAQIYPNMCAYFEQKRFFL